MNMQLRQCFFQRQAFSTEKSQIASGFFYFQKSQRSSK